MRLAVAHFEPKRVEFCESHSAVTTVPSSGALATLQQLSSEFARLKPFLII